MRNLFWSPRNTGSVLLSLITLIVMVAGMAAASGYPNGHLLVEPSWLAENLNRADLRIIDLRSANEYGRAHIPGAVNIPGSGALNDPDADVGGWLLGPEDFTELMQSLGVSENTSVVVYDQADGLAAARLFYALELYGHFDKVSLLNGGFTAWVDERRPIDRSVPNVARGDFVATLVPERIATAEYVAEKLKSADALILDTRSLAEFTGESVRAARGGTIPNSVHLEWTNNVSESGKFKSADDLFDMYAAIGANPEDEIIPFCQTNVRGAHTYFTLRLLGYENVRPYEGSWSEWGNRDDLPVVIGQLL